MKKLLGACLAAVLALAGCPQSGGGDGEIPPPARYTLSFDTHGGSEVQPISADEGTEVDKPGDPTRNNDTFSGWFSAETAGAKYAWPHSLSGNLVMHAQWEPQPPVESPPTELNISVWVNGDGDILASNDDITISKSGAGNLDSAFTAAVSGAYSGVRWYFNNETVEESRGAAQSITVSAADYVNGNYYLGVTVTKDNVPCSTSIRFTVVD
jgi:uncharacterized repeat protein (TIGR02543 family)